MLKYYIKAAKLCSLESFQWRLWQLPSQHCCRNSDHLRERMLLILSGGPQDDTLLYCPRLRASQRNSRAHHQHYIVCNWYILLAGYRIPKRTFLQKHSQMHSLLHLQIGRKISRGDVIEAFLRLRKNISLNFVELDHINLHQKNKCSGMTFEKKRTKDLI